MPNNARIVVTKKDGTVYTCGANTNDGAVIVYPLNPPSQKLNVIHGGVTTQVLATDIQSVSWTPPT